MEMEMTETKNHHEKVRGIVQDIVEAIVDRPELVKVSVTQGDKNFMYEINVPQEERGKVIGKDGQMAKCLRHLITSLSAKNGARALLDICD